MAKRLVLNLTWAGISFADCHAAIKVLETAADAAGGEDDPEGKKLLAVAEALHAISNDTDCIVIEQEV